MECVFPPSTIFSSSYKIYPAVLSSLGSFEMFMYLLHKSTFRNESPVTVFRTDVISAMDLTEYQYKKNINKLV